MIFDIEHFYSSIKEETLIKALDFAKCNTKVLKKDIDVIRHARRSLLFNHGIPWVKKEEENFDVTMGAYDGAEICELVGIFRPNLARSLIKKTSDCTETMGSQSSGKPVDHKQNASKKRFRRSSRKIILISQLHAT